MVQIGLGRGSRYLVITFALNMESWLDHVLFKHDALGIQLVLNFKLKDISANTDLAWYKIEKYVLGYQRSFCDFNN